MDHKFSSEEEKLGIRVPAIFSMEEKYFCEDDSWVLSFLKNLSEIAIIFVLVSAGR